MTETLERIVGPVNIASGTSSVFTGTSGHVYTVKNIRIVNTTADTVTVALGIGGVADADLILASTDLGPSESCEFDGVLVLAGTDTLQADASESGLTITMSGLDQGP